jgi:membrane associated rhomboid family serine protease
MDRMSPGVIVLLLINIAVFAAERLVPGWRAPFVLNGAFWFSGNENFAPWQLFTYMFLHADFGHLFMNMFALLSFGLLLERRWGTGRFLLFYLLCGIGAALIHNGVNMYQYRLLYAELVDAGMPPDAISTLMATSYGQFPAVVEKTMGELYQIYAAPMLGASGAIYGVLVAFGMLYPNAKLALLFLPVPIAAKIFVPIILAIDLLSGVTGFSLLGRGVAHFAHLGGAAVGFLLMLLWRRQDRSREFEPFAARSL